MKIIIAGLMMLMMTALQAAATVINLTPTQDTFQVTLPSNPTTGYQWSIKSYDQTLLNLVSSKFIQPQTKLMGAGGTMLYTFELKKGVNPPKLTSLVFSYARPWEAEKGSLQTVTVNFEKTEVME